MAFNKHISDRMNVFICFPACLRCLPKTAKEDKVAIEDVVSFNLNITEKLAVYLLTSADGQIQHVVSESNCRAVVPSSAHSKGFIWDPHTLVGSFGPFFLLKF